MSVVLSGVHVVVPDGIDDQSRPSGGNAYDRRVCRGLEAAGWIVHEHAVSGSWPRPGTGDRTGLARVVAGVPDGALLLVDGLIASTVPEVLVPEADRVRLVVLVHLPLGCGLPGEDVAGARTRERAVLGAAAAVVTTSGWTRRWLLETYALDPALVHVAAPGVDTAGAASAGPTPSADTGSRLLCVAAVTAAKGHDVLLAALASIRHLPWSCTCVGGLDREPEFVAGLVDLLVEEGLEGRIRLVGPRTRHDLEEAYATADLLVLPSRTETYGMVVTEALARGLPVVASDAGGVREALGRGRGGTRPGLLVPPDDPAALAGALARWLTDDDLRKRLREAARQRRATLSGWAVTALRVSQVLSEVAA